MTQKFFQNINNLKIKNIFKKKKMWYLYTMGFYSATKKNEILSFTSKWMELENIILSEVSQAQKAKRHMFSCICELQT
jgi:hypothetical protein